MELIKRLTKTAALSDVRHLDKLGLMPARLDQFCIYPKGYGLVYFCKGWEEDEYCREEHDLVTFKGDTC